MMKPRKSQAHPETQKHEDRFPRSKKMLSSPDVSRILRVPGEEEPEEFYDHPLHSTAVYGEDPLEKEEFTQCNTSPKSLPKARSQASRQKNSKHLQTLNTPKRKGSKFLKEASDESTVPETRNTLRKSKTFEEQLPSSSLKTVSMASGSDDIMDAKSEAGGPVESSGNPVQSLQDDPTPNSENPSDTPVGTGASISEDGHQEIESCLPAKKGLHQEETGNSVPRLNGKSKGKKRKKSNHHKALDSTDGAGPSHTAILCPEGIQRSPKDLTELDVVLDKFEKVITNYKMTVQSDLGKKTIDRFFSILKKQLNKTSEEVHRLKNLKKKNAKMHLQINKKRRRLVEVKEELIVNELKQKQLLREYNALQENVSSFKNIAQFLHDLRELQREYLKYKEQNPQEKEEYGISSLPALLLESRTVLEAEKHLHNINTKLQRWLDMEKESENLSQKV